MAISAKDVMTLRQQTGAGMMECKKALEESDGDFQAAVKYLRERGIASAAKREGKEANEGRVVVRVNEDSTAGAIVEVNSETDFVARNSEFVAMASRLGDEAMKVGADKAGANAMIPADALDLDGLKELAGRIRENLGVGRAAYVSAPEGFIDAYVHPGDQLGVLLVLTGDAARSEAGRALGHDLALQIAAAAPKYVRSEEVPASVIEAEKEIYKQQMRNEGKPEQIVDKIALGKLNKFYEDICLIDQIYVKDPKQKVRDRIAEAVKAGGGSIEVERFLRFRVGESEEQ